jgi:hypothetical protein
LTILVVISAVTSGCSLLLNLEDLTATNDRSGAGSGGAGNNGNAAGNTSEGGNGTSQTGGSSFAGVSASGGNAGNGNGGTVGGAGSAGQGGTLATGGIYSGGASANAGSAGTNLGGSGGCPSPLEWYRDLDKDGHGDAASKLTACAQPTGYIGTSDDCDDSNAFKFGGAPEACDGIDNDCDSRTADNCNAGCFGKAYANHGYMLCSPAVNYPSAQSICSAVGMRLVRIDDVNENSFVTEQLSSLDIYVWIGGVRSGTGWAWQDGQLFYDGGPLLFANWVSGTLPGTSDHNCVQIEQQNSGKWTPARCTDTQPLICERY